MRAKVAAEASDAGLRARPASVELLGRDSAAVSSFAAMANYIRGILERDTSALVDAAVALRACRPLLSASAAEDAARELFPGNKSQAMSDSCPFRTNQQSYLDRLSTLALHCN